MGRSSVACAGPSPVVGVSMLTRSLAVAQAKEREAVKAGKKPFYLKKGDLRKAELVEKYKVRSVR